MNRPASSASAVGARNPVSLTEMVREPVWRRRTAEPVVVAFLGTVLVHLLLVLAAPKELSRTPPEPRDTRRSLEIVLEPLPEPDEEELSEQFIIPNPDVPSHPPDHSRHFADRDQEAAQEEASEEEQHTPEIEADLDEPTQNIVEEEVVTEPVPPEEWEMAGEDFGLPGIEGRPIEGFSSAEEEEGTEVPVTEEAAEPEEETEVAIDLDGLTDSGEREEAGENEREVTPVPQPRPRVSPRTSGPVGPRSGGTTRVGTLSVDANFSEFGDYLARLLEAVSRQWHQLAWEALPSGEVGTIVAVSFQIDKNGEVRNAQVDRSTAGLTATLICKDAITSRQPFGPWTREMTEILGEEQTVRIRFHYR